jgi:hypothetical protein
MLVSTHNLGSVPEFCDRTVLLNRTVLAYGPRSRFSPGEPEKTFGGVLRHFVLNESEGGKLRALDVITDDERAGSFQDGHATRRKSSSGDEDRISVRCSNPSPTSTCSMPWVAALVGGVCAFLRLSDAEGLVADRRRAFTPSCPVSPAPTCSACRFHRRLSSGEPCGSGHAFLNQRTVERGRHHRPDLFLLFRPRLSGVALPTSVNIQTIVLGNIPAITPKTPCSSPSSVCPSPFSSSNGRT